MYILGITGFTHDSAACLIKDGETIQFIEEERINREKHTSAFPRLAIEKCLELEGITITDVDHFAFFSIPHREITGNVSHFLRYFPGSLKLLSSKSAGANKDPFLSRMRRKLMIGSVLKREFSLERAPKVHYVEHHLSHAASCFYPSPFREAAIMTIDGRGENVTAMLGRGSGNSITKITEIRVPHSLGHFYSAITDYLGFHAFHDEWKVMGLSAYGTGTYLDLFNQMIRYEGKGQFRLDLSYFSFHTIGQGQWMSGKFSKVFGPPRKKEDPLEQRHFDLAFALQRTLEMIGVDMANYLHQQTKLDALCLAGGVVLNCLMNSEIMKKTPFQEVFIQPLANDAGTAMGCGLYLNHHLLRRETRSSLKNIYLGPGYADEAIVTALKERNLPIHREENIAQSVSRLLAKNRIVGWFQGRMEAGPRALGNRSILVNPSDPGMKDRLNSRVKKREFFRPFAPSVMEEYQSEYFDLPKNLSSPHMILTGVVRPEKRSQIPAVTHRDFTARVQTVSKATNPKFHALLEEFRKITGVPVLLNTSFNENEPIVCTPVEAIDCFLRTDMDDLALGDYLVSKGSWIHGEGGPQA